MPQPRSRRRLSQSLAVVLLTATFAAVVPASVHIRAASPPATLVSTENGSTPIDATNQWPSISGDGQFVAFTAATQISPGFARPQGFPSGFAHEVWLFDRAAGTAARVPLPANGQESAGGVISRDGCAIAFWARAGVDNTSWDVYRWNRCNGGPPQLVSQAFGDFNSCCADLGRLAISGSGRYVAYTAANDGPSTVHAYVVDADLGTARELPGPYTAPSSGVQNLEIDISDDGAYVALEGLEGGTNLIVGWVVGTGARERITVRTDGVIPSPNSRGADPSVSADGRYVAFSSTEEGPNEQVYVHDRATNTTRRVTAILGGPANGVTAEDPEISPDGTQVVYEQDGPGHDTFWIQVVRSTSGFFDTAAFDLVSYGVDDLPAQSDTPTMSSTGRYVAFGSYDGDRLSGNPGFPAGHDVWLRERPPALSITTPVDFGSVTVGGQVGPKPVTITNTSNVIIPISGVTPPAPPFSITTDGCSGAVLQPGATCALAVVFAPGAPGNAASSVAVGGEGVTVAADLTGNAATPGTLTLTPVSQNFGAGSLGTSFPASGFTVTNTGGSPVGVNTVTLGGGDADQFAIDADGCSTVVLAPATSCQIAVSATVTRAGLQSGNLDVTGANGQNLGAALQVTGTVPTTTTPPPTSSAGALTLTPASADYGTAELGVALAPQVFTARNTGGQALTVSGVGLSGSGASQFSIGVNGCNNKVLAPNATCQIQVAAIPTVAGTSAATLSVSGNGGQSDTSALTVTGTATPMPFTPQLVMNPGVVRPGQVTNALGTGFPPGAVVQLAFTGEAPFATVTADGAGSFTHSMLMLPNGVRGGGQQVLALDQPEFSGVRAPLLIHQASFEPSGANDAGFTNGLRTLYGRGG